MIASIRGTIVEKSPSEVTLNIGAVSLFVMISESTFSRLPHEGESCELVTYLVVREDALTLFGFYAEEERALFKLLIGVSGIGPKLAQAILSGMTVMDIRESILSNNASRLTRISGVGKKTAERVILELRDKITKLTSRTSEASLVSSSQQVREDAFAALLALGFSKPIAEKALRQAITESPDASTEVLIKTALRAAQKESR